MPNYKNNSSSIKTFYGVEFKPGEVHSVPGYINAKGMFRVKDTFFQKLSEDITDKVESKPEVVYEDVTDVLSASNIEDLVENTEVKDSETPVEELKPRKHGKGKKSKKILDTITETPFDSTTEEVQESTTEEISEEPILSDFIKEGEENG